MRILLCTQPTDGGVGRHVCDLIEGLTAKGHEVILCSPAIPPGLRQPVAHVRLDLRRAIAPSADLAALARLVRVVRDLKPDLIHAHSSKAGAIARLARLFSPRLPVLYTPHGYAFAGHFNHSAERLAYRLVERALAPLASRVVCVCEAEARLARSVGPSSRVRVIHNGIAPAPEGDADPRVAELTHGGPVIGALTLLRPGKGLETLIAALPEVLARHGDARVAIVGEGPDLDALQAQSRTLGVADAVHFLGPSTDPLSALRGMDVFVHPSWAEAFPYVILEAMSLARPILASDVGGIGEAVIDGESGVLIPPRDAHRLGGALIGLLEDPTRRALLGEAALRRVGQEFTRSVMIDRMTAVYVEAVRSPSSPSAPAEKPHVRPAAIADARAPLVRDGER
jgi:glycosyltransferase involved in cell wall biosynthesis